MTLTKSSPERIMETDKVGSLLFRLSLPQVFTNVIAVITGFFSGSVISFMDIDFLTVYTITLPLCSSVLYALTCGVCCGSASFIAANLCDKKKICSVISDGLLLLNIAYLLFLLICTFAAEPYMRIFSSKPHIVELGIKYIRLSLVPAFFTTVGTFLMQVLQSMGETALTSAFNLLSIPLSLGLTFVLVFGFGAIPSCGLFGLIYTLLIIGVLRTVFCVFLLRKRKLKRILFRPDFKNIKTVMSVAVPAMLQQALATVLVSGFNLIMSSVNEDYMVIMGIFYKWNSLAQSFILRTSLMPVIGYNSSIHRFDRVRRTVRNSLVYITLVGAVFTLFMMFFTKQCLLMFNCPDSMLETGATIIRILSIYMLPMSIVTTLSNSSIAIGDGKLGMAALIVQTAIALAGGFVMQNFGGVFSALTFPIAEFAALAAVMLMIFKRSEYLNLRI